MKRVCLWKKNIPRKEEMIISISPLYGVPHVENGISLQDRLSFV